MAIITIINSKRDVPRSIVVKAPLISKYFNVDSPDNSEFENKHSSAPLFKYDVWCYEGDYSIGATMNQILGVSGEGFFKVKSIRGKDNSIIGYNEKVSGTVDASWAFDGKREGKVKIDEIIDSSARMYFAGKLYYTETEEEPAPEYSNFNLIVDIEYSRNKISWLPVSIEFDFKNAGIDLRPGITGIR